MFHRRNLPKIGQKVRLYSSHGDIHEVKEIVSRSFPGDGWNPDPTSYYVKLEGLDGKYPIESLIPVEN